MYLSCRKVGACDHVVDLTYEFSRNHISEVLQIMQTVRRDPVDMLKDVDEDLIPDKQQAIWDMISEEGIADGGDEDKSDDEEGNDEGDSDGEEDDSDQSN